MFISFDEQAFWNAVSTKNYQHLKINTISTIRNDPTFSGKELADILKVFEDKKLDIFEEERKLSYEYRLDRSQWTKEYFIRLTCWFQDNFALSRLGHIKEVGQYVYAQEAQKGGGDHPHIAPERCKNSKSKAILFVATVALVLVIIVVVLLMRNL